MYELQKVFFTPDWNRALISYVRNEEKPGHLIVEFLANKLRQFFFEPWQCARIYAQTHAGEERERGSAYFLGLKRVSPISKTVHVAVGFI